MNYKVSRIYILDAAPTNIDETIVSLFPQFYLVAP